MSDERQAFEQLHAIPSGVEWCEKRHIYIHKNYSGLVLHPINESWEAFCEGALWQASREEGEPIGEVGYMIQPNWDDPSKTKGVALVDKSLAPGTKLYTHPASRQALSSCSEIPNNSVHASRQALEGEPDDRISVHEYTARIALQALEEYAENLSIVAGWDYEPLEHHYAQQAIEDIQDKLTEKERGHD